MVSHSETTVWPRFYFLALSIFQQVLNINRIATSETAVCVSVSFVDVERKCLGLWGET